MSSIPPGEVLVLVEGDSDAVVVRRLLHSGRVPARVIPMHGVTNIDRWLGRCAADASVERVAGLYDLAEERFVRRALRRRGVVVDDGLSRAGFFECDRDLEEELIRAVGADRAAASLTDIGLAGTFRTFGQQPQWRGRPLAALVAYVRAGP